MNRNHIIRTKAVMALVLAAAMICGMLPQSVLAAESTTTSYVAITSDIHDKQDYYQSWMTSLKDITTSLSYMIFGGDYVGSSQAATMKNIAQSTFPGVPVAQAQGNHDGTGSYDSGLVYNRDDFAVYVLSIKTGEQTIATDASALDAALAGIDAAKPVFVICHYPLHYISSRTTMNALDFITVLNKYPNAIYCWGHNHSQNDPAYTGSTIKMADDTINYSSGGSSTINFTYVCMGSILTYPNTYAGVLATLSATGAETSIRFDYISTSGDIVKNYTLTLSGGTAPEAETPTIETQPADVSVEVGETASLAVAAHVNDGGTLSYQWYDSASGSNSGGEAISGETGSAYTVPTDAAGTAYYYCTVTNTLGTSTACATSDAAGVTVLESAQSGEGSTWDGSVATGFGGGSGTSSDPYLIATGAQLAYLAAQVNAGTSYSGTYFEQANDINLNSQEWTPAGAYYSNSATNYSFSGTYDGGGHIISNLKIARSFAGTASTNKAYGLFGYLSGTVSNLGLTGLSISVSNTQSGSSSGTFNAYAGGIAGYIGTSSSSRGYIYNSYAEGSVSASTASSSARCCAGGLGGYFAYGTITNSYAAAAASRSGTYTSSNSGHGGMMGYNSGGTFSQSYWNSTLTTYGANSSASSVSGLSAKTTTEMKASDFVALLNTNAGSYFAWMSDAAGLNGGYPIHERTTTPVGISSVAATITAPVAGAAPDTTASVTTTGVTASAITWSPSVTTAFGYSTVYTASVTLTPSGTYYFASGATATVNGNTASATLNGDGTLSVTHAFEATDAQPSTTYQLASSIESGASYVMVYKESGSNTSGYALTNNASTSNYLDGTAVTTSGNNIISTVSDSMIWTLTTGETTGSYDVKNGAYYLLRISGTNGYVNVGTTDTGNGYSDWVYAYGDSGSQMYATGGSGGSTKYYLTRGSSGFYAPTSSSSKIYLYKVVSGPVTTIDSVAITEIDAPALGGTPDTSATVSPEGVTASAVTWTPAASAFEPGTEYTASVTLTADSGYAFASGAAATVNGNAAVVTLNGDGTLRVTYAFAATEKQSISSVAATITAPVAGAAPNTTASVTTTGVTAGAITWSPSVTTAFGYSTVYTASVTLTPSGTYYFASGATATVNGSAASATLNGDGTLRVTYAFDATADIGATGIIYKQVGAITAGSDYIVAAYYNGSYYAIDQASSAGGYSVASTGVTVIDGASYGLSGTNVIADPSDSSLVWTASAGSSSNYRYLKNGTYYLYGGLVTSSGGTGSSGTAGLYAITTSRNCSLSGTRLSFSGNSTYYVTYASGAFSVSTSSSSAAAVYFFEKTTYSGVSVGSAAVTVAEPVAGAAPNTTASVTTAGVTAGAITWSPSVTTAFGYNTVYTASLTLTAISGYAFASGATATVNGNAASATLNGDGTLSVTYQFAATNMDPPNITLHPQDKTVAEEDTAELSVTASASGTLSYQWYGNTANSNSGGTLIADATSSAYSAPTGTVGIVYYYCVVTNTDNSVAGSKTASAASDAAKVTVKLATIRSNTYAIDRMAHILSEVTAGTTVAGFKAKLLNDAEDIKLFDQNDKEYTDNAVMTGMTVKLIINGIERDRLRISVFGDVDGNGLIDVTDIVYIRSYILGTYSMSGEEFLAADINKDTELDISDILYIRAHILNTYTITAK